MPRLILGSASPRRAALLSEIGVSFEIRASDLPEVPAEGESPADFARRAALEKALAVAAQSSGAWVLGADTVVAIGDCILGKPVDADDARRMLRKLSGRLHHVVTGVALIDPRGEVSAALSVDTEVEFRRLGEDEIAAYVASGEPMDKAGAYAIQGGAAGFVERVRGSYTNVVGLPIDEVRELLHGEGLC